MATIEATEVIEKEGFLRKRSGRMHRWTNRYFYLTATKISYKQKPDSSAFKGTFDLAPGSIVTDVQEESIGTIKGKKIFVFWLVWPHDKNCKSSDEKGEDSEEEFEHPINSVTKDTKESKIEAISKEGEVAKAQSKDLRDIIEREQSSHRKLQQQVEEQVNRHEANDKNMSFRYTVAAAAAGGVVVGALTAGIGLVPYLAVVGTVAAVGVGGGGIVAFSKRRPFDSRLMLASESLSDALAWKHTIELQVANLNKIFLPPTADPTVISNIIGLSVGGGGWKRREFVEGMRIMEQDVRSSSTKCMKGQVMVNTPTFPTFLALMNGKFWPQGGSLTVLETLDDHADIIGVEVKTNYSEARSGLGIMREERSVVRRLCLSRFWKRDDDGIFLITLNNASHPNFQVSAKRIDRKEKTLEGVKATVDAVITVSPRKDHNVFDDELAESLVCCTVQASIDGWFDGEMDQFLINFLTQNLLEMKHALLLSKFSVEEDIHVSSTDVIQVSSSQSSSALHQPPGSGKPMLTKSRSGYGLGSTVSNSKSATRGIASIQPGMEDVGALRTPASTAETSPVAPNHASPGTLRKYLSSTSVSVSSPDQQGLSHDVAVGTEKKKRTIFGSALATKDKDKKMEKGKETPVVPVDPVALDKSGSRGNSPGRRVGHHETEGRHARAAASVSSRRKSVNSVAVNTKASHLRDEIACKEYEVARLEKQVNPANQPQLATAGDSLASSKAMLRRPSEMTTALQLTELVIEINQMKEEYLELTGKNYESAIESKKRRRIIRYWRGDKDSVEAKLIPLSSENVVVSHANFSVQNEAYRGLPALNNRDGRPVHWSYPIRELKSDVCVHDLSTLEFKSHAELNPLASQYELSARRQLAGNCKSADEADSAWGNAVVIVLLCAMIAFTSFISELFGTIAI